MIRREKRHRGTPSGSPQSPCGCRRGFVPRQYFPKPWHARIDWMQVVCPLAFGLMGLMGWTALLAGLADAYLVDGSLLGEGLLLCAVFWILAGLCGWWSVAPFFEEMMDQGEENE